ncbi:unnamed protein product, partial [marine sediment metagenome]
MKPYQVFHQGVGFDDSGPIDTYLLYGGNYVERFMPINKFEVLKFGTGGGLLTHSV